MAEFNIEHLMDCLEQHQKGELTDEQVKEALTQNEKMFLITHQEHLKTDDGMLAQSKKDEVFFMVVETDESTYHEAESILNELGSDMSLAIDVFLKQLIKTKELPLVTLDEK